MLDTLTGLMRCFANPIKTKPIQSYFLQECELRRASAFARDSKGSLECFEIYSPKKKVAMLIIPEAGTDVEELRTAFDFCTKVHANSPRSCLRQGKPQWATR